MRARAAVLALLVLAATAGCGSAQMVVTAQFRDAVGVYVGNEVSVLGIPVGRVTAIAPSGTHVTVELTLDPDTAIPADAGAVTVSPSVVTDRRVELTPAYTGGPRMRGGDLIPLDRTRTPVEIDRVLAAVDRLASQLSVTEGGTGVISEALGVTAETLRGNGEKLRNALRGFAGAVGVGADQRDALVDLIQDVDRLTTAAAGQDATIRSFSTHLTEVTELLDQQGPELVATLDTVTELLDRAETIIRENRPAAGRTVDALGVTAETLAGRTAELAEAADVLPTLFRNLVAIVDPVSKRARIHDSADQLLRAQLVKDLCQRFGQDLCPGGTPAPWLGMYTGGAR